MTYMNEENPSKKKYLVPLVVLLLCGVAMTGAAFAYSATLEGGSDPTPADALKLTFTDKGKTAGTFAFSESPSAISYKSKTTYESSDWVTKYALDDGTYEYTFKVTGDKNFRVTACTVTIFMSTDGGANWSENPTGFSAAPNTFSDDLETTQEVTFTVTTTGSDDYSITETQLKNYQFKFEVVVSGTTDPAA